MAKPELSGENREFKNKPREHPSASSRLALLNLRMGIPETAALPRAPLKSVQELTERLFEETPHIKPPEGTYNRRKIDLWKKRYSDQDKAYNKLRKLKKARRKTMHQRLTEGWNRLTKSGQFQRVYEICLEERVPFEIVFLAMAESHWQSKVCSRVGACGYWQFMPRTARAYGLRIDKKRDDRRDFEKSTRAAIRYLKGLYRNTFVWDGKKVPKNFSYTDSDRWAFAFWSYNRGPGKVKPYYKKLKGKSAGYASMLGRINPESANYVNKIFGIREALVAYAAAKGAKPAVVATAPKSPEAVSAPAEQAAEQAPKKSRADLMYENYTAQESNISPKEKLQTLAKIRTAYEQEGKKGAHDADYVDDAIEVIDEEIASVKKENAAALAETSSEKGTTARVTVGRGGEMDVKIEDGEKFHADVVGYKVQHGDNFTKIAIRLTGDPNKLGLTKKILRAVNPEIENIDVVKVGQTMRVPGRFITVPPVKLARILKKYYPNVPAKDAEYYLKWLNGKKPGVDVVKVGEVILVPAVK